MTDKAQSDESNRDSEDSNSKWDRIGFWASSACAVHCLLSPLLFLAIPAFAKIWAHPATHAIMALLVVPLALMVLFRGYRVHRTKWVAVAAGLGVVCILIGSMLPYMNETGASGVHASQEEACSSCCPSVATTASGETTINFPPATIITILGSVFLIAAHVGNMLACRRCCRREEKLVSMPVGDLAAEVAAS